MPKRGTTVDAQYWMAPEIAHKKEGSTKSDVWSAGILSLDLWDAVPPYAHLSPGQAIYAIACLPPPQSKNVQGISKTNPTLVHGCLQVKEEDRMDIKSLLQLPITRNATPQTLQVLKTIATAYEYQRIDEVPKSRATACEYHLKVEAREARVEELRKSRVGDRWQMIYKDVHHVSDGGSDHR